MDGEGKASSMCDGPEATSNILEQMGIIELVHGSSSSDNAHQEFRSLPATDSTTINKATKKQKTAEDTSAPEWMEKIKKKKIIKAGPAEPPDLPQLIKEKIKNPTLKPMLILQKGLTKSDEDRNQNRLSIPISKLDTTEFLQGGEKVQASERIQGGRGEVKGCDVTVIDPVGNIIRGDGKVKLKEWKTGTYTDYYVLTGSWDKGSWHRDFIHKNGLKEGDIIQIWFYRDADRKPCFAIVKL